MYTIIISALKLCLVWSASYIYRPIPQFTVLIMRFACAWKPQRNRSDRLVWPDYSLSYILLYRDMTVSELVELESWAALIVEALVLIPEKCWQFPCLLVPEVQESPTHPSYKRPFTKEKGDYCLRWARHVVIVVMNIIINNAIVCIRYRAAWSRTTLPARNRDKSYICECKSLKNLPY